MSIPFNFRLTDFPVEAETLRLEVREFLSSALVDVPKETRAETWYGADEDFCRKVGERGWIGLSWPTEYGKICCARRNVNCRCSCRRSLDS